MRRRQLLTNLPLTAAAAAGTPPPGGDAPAGDAHQGELLVHRVRDAMLGLTPPAAAVAPRQLQTDLGHALADFHACRYRRLSSALPQLITTAHSLPAGGDDPAERDLSAEIYLLVTRMLIKLDEHHLGLMAADRARALAHGGDNPLTIAEAARNLAVLARRAGWHAQAIAITLDATDDPRLHDGRAATTAERGLLIQSAAYTAARAGDADGMRQLTDEAAALAARLAGPPLLRDHGGGFSPATVQLHRISAENSLHQPGAALAAARALPPATLPTTERRARYYTDLATAFGQAGRRDQCIRALLAAEHHAPEDTHTRPAVRTLITGLLTSGRTTPDLRGLAARSGIR